MTSSPKTPPKVWLQTLGCAKNQVDSDKLNAQLSEAGYEWTQQIDDADVVMVNTCAFIEAARQESIDAVLDAAGQKKDDARVVVLGCMAQRYETELAAALPEVDEVVGLDRYGELVGRLDDISTDGMELIEQICTIYRNYGFDTQVLVASVRHPVHVVQAGLLGAHVATMPPKVIGQLAHHPLTDIGLERFLADWEKVKNRS